MKLKRIILLLLTVMFSFSYGEVFAKDGNSLKKALKNKFLIGVSVNTHQSSGKDVAAVEIVKKNFNSIVAENCMKSSVIHPKENKYNFAQADEFVSFGESNQMAIIGHCLIWHSQLAPWFCVDKDGNNVSPEVLKKRMKDHITTIVKRYKGRIKGWDVVNEAIEDNGAYRKTKFYEILGEEYIPLAFQYAHEADPDAELYYNDYSMAQPGRREAVVKMVNDLKKRGIRIDAIGMQGHIGMDNVGAEVTASFEYKKEMNPYPDGLPEEVSKAWTERMNDFFRLFLKHHNLITRVTLWGVADQNSWRNDWPMRGRTDYPLLFDRNYQPKPVVGLIIKEAEKTK